MRITAALFAYVLSFGPVGAARADDHDADEAPAEAAAVVRGGGNALGGTGVSQGGKDGKAAASSGAGASGAARGSGGGAPSGGSAPLPAPKDCGIVPVSWGPNNSASNPRLSQPMGSSRAYAIARGVMPTKTSGGATLFNWQVQNADCRATMSFSASPCAFPKSACTRRAGRGINRISVREGGGSQGDGYCPMPPSTGLYYLNVRADEPLSGSAQADAKSCSYFLHYGM